MACWGGRLGGWVDKGRSDLVEVVVEALVELEVLDDAGQEDEVVEALGHGVL